jgi:hypothetical protein
MQAFAVDRDVLPGMIGEGEVREEQAARMQVGDGIERSVPEFERNVGWRSGGKNKRMPEDGDAGGSK